MLNGHLIYRANWDLIDRNYNPPRPLRVLFLTSIRDVGECDRNGQTVPTPDRPVYMKGVIEHCVEETYPGRALHRLVQVVGVVTDDAPSDLKDYPVEPIAGRPWIHPINLRNSDGTRIGSLTRNIPSTFRKWPLTATAHRKQLKESYERSILELKKSLRADVIVSDHLMFWVEHLIKELGLFGQVLNMHPAITIAGHPFWFPGKTPTNDAIALAARQKGVLTGATLQIMDEVIDHGPAIAYQCATPVHAHDEEQHVRARNYPLKCRVFVEGMIHYARHVYPHLGRLNFENFSERAWIRGK